MDNKIGLIITGGTIGTVTKNKKNKKDNSDKKQDVIYNSNMVLRGLDKSTVKDFIKLYGFSEYSIPYYILSENLEFSNLYALYKEVKNQLQNKDACIITVGTDTLFYVSSYLCISLAHTNKTVVLVSSDYPLDNKRANGYYNMDIALRFISKKISGVYVAYKNKGERAKIFHGARLVASRNFDGYVSSADSKNIAILNKNGEIKINNSNITKTKSINTFNNVSYDISNVSNVLFIYPYVGIDYNRVKNSINSDTIIVHDSYHSGTVNSQGKNNINIINNQEIYIAGGLKGEKYESLTNFPVNNIMSIDNITPTSLYFKVLFSAHLDKKSRQEYLLSNISGEFFK